MGKVEIQRRFSICFLVSNLVSHTAIMTFSIQNGVMGSIINAQILAATEYRASFFSIKPRINGAAQGIEVMILARIQLIQPSLVRKSSLRVFLKYSILTIFISNRSFYYIGNTRTTCNFRLTIFVDYIITHMIPIIVNNALSDGSLFRIVHSKITTTREQS